MTHRYSDSYMTKWVRDICMTPWVRDMYIWIRDMYTLPWGHTKKLILKKFMTNWDPLSSWHVHLRSWHVHLNARYVHTAVKTYERTYFNLHDIFIPHDPLSTWDLRDELRSWYLHDALSSWSTSMTHWERDVWVIRWVRDIYMTHALRDIYITRRIEFVRLRWLLPIRIYMTRWVRDEEMDSLSSW